MKRLANIKIQLFVLSTLLAVSACRKEVTEFTDTPIIESYLKPGDFLNVKVSRQIPFSSAVSYSSDDIDHLSLHVTVNNTMHTLQPVGNGSYVDSSYKVNASDNFNLYLEYNSKTITASTTIPVKPGNATQSVTEISLQKIDSTTVPNFNDQPDPVKITWDNTDNSPYLIAVENVESNPELIRELKSNITRPANIFRKQPTNASSEEIRPMEFQYFGKTRIVILHVLPDYAALYDQSSTSSQNLSNPSTSIKNGYGIFTGLNADTLWINIKKK